MLEVGVPSAKPVSKFQPVLRDVAVWVSLEQPVQELIDLVRKQAKKDERLLGLTSFNLFDVYRPKEDDEHAKQKSLAFSMKLQLLNEPISEGQADDAVNAVVEILASKGAQLRN